ncbi:DNA-3-methyladenine glycosylase [Kovacikia minuta CCNUW1]|uniref:DNA-3-methyladenine glycosylase n=1 Tax=Kovacikia minuta TaxID=2931930 RepID=UPI001CCA5957|nr:DNA-3-methyladenine glycosylase [Kovacikia minuta]UBF29022.1 DNA-3-methyladenine glycosylase [Kovacikia minuta CCNUW1]
MNTSFVNATWLNRPSTQVAPDLIGCTLVRQMSDRKIFRGLIVETEAYEPNDPACHAYRRQTPRNQVMFGPAGMTYVYLIYGMYCCLNLVTDREGVPSAVLIRALQLETIPPWIDLLKHSKPDRIAAGPGKLCRALQIDQSLTAQPLQLGQALWLEHRSSEFQIALNEGDRALIQTTRIGLTQGTDLPWRWYLAGCPAVSRK